MSDIGFLSARQLLEMLKRREVSSTGLVEHFIARIEAHDPRVNAVVVRLFERARAEAAEADAVRAAGGAHGPLHGIPMTIKESFQVVGTPTTFGFEAFANNVAETDALAVQRLRAAGAIILGKTNVPPGLADGQSVNPIYGRTNNPWNLDRTPGGSSGGSAAALAAGFSGLDFGSDIASSIRNPAHYCGIFGHKPTYGICPTDGHALRSGNQPLDIGVIGPLARSAGDLRLALEVVAGASPPQSAAWRLKLPDTPKRQLRDFTVGLVVNDHLAEVDAEVSVLLDQLGRSLEQAGATVLRDHRPDFDSRELLALYLILLRAASSASLSDEALAQASATAAGANRFCRDAAVLNAYGASLPHRDWLRLDAERRRVRQAWQDYFVDVDLLLCPPLSTAAFPHSKLPPQQRKLHVNGRDVPFENQLFWAGYAGVAYFPASVAPIGLTSDGLPVGVQIIGPEFSDLTCLAFAELLEREFRGFVPPPAFAA